MTTKQVRWLKLGYDANIKSGNSEAFNTLAVQWFGDREASVAERIDALVQVVAATLAVAFELV